MDSFLRKHKLIDTLSLTLNCDKNTFIEKFNQNVEKSDLSVVDSLFEALLSGTDLRFKGYLDGNDFKIRKKKKLFARNNAVLGKGTISEFKSELKICINFNEFQPIAKLFFYFISILYLLILTIFSYHSIIKKDFSSLAIPLFLLYGLLIYSILYSVITSSVQSFKQEIEREFHFWLK